MRFAKWVFLLAGVSGKGASDLGERMDEFTTVIVNGVTQHVTGE
jgi:hypothetical protein